MPLPIRIATYAPPRMCYPAEFDRSRSNGTSIIKEIQLKNFTCRIPRFKVTQGHQNRPGVICHL